MKNPVKMKFQKRKRWLRPCELVIGVVRFLLKGDMCKEGTATPGYLSKRVSTLTDLMRWSHFGSMAASSLRIICPTSAYADAKNLHRFGNLMHFKICFAV